MDRRDQILKDELGALPFKIPETAIPCIKNAMDENGKRLCLELLEYMAKNDIKCTWYEHEVLGIQYRFHYKGRDITKEQLFENFL